MSKSLEYTTDMLTKNFELIDKILVSTTSNIEGLVANEASIIETLGINVDVLERLEGRIQALENIKLVIRAPRGSKLFLLSACGLAAYAGYKYALYKVNDMMDREEQHIKSRVDHPAGRKIHVGETNPVPEPKIDYTNPTPENN